MARTYGGPNPPDNPKGIGKKGGQTKRPSRVMKRVSVPGSATSMTANEKAVRKSARKTR